MSLWGHTLATHMYEPKKKRYDPIASLPPVFIRLVVEKYKTIICLPGGMAYYNLFI